MSKPDFLLKLEQTIVDAQVAATNTLNSATAAIAAITPASIGAIPTTAIGAASGVAGLDSTAKLPVLQLPANMTGDKITVGQYEIAYNATTQTLDFNYIGT